MVGGGHGEGRQYPLATLVKTPLVQVRVVEALAVQVETEEMDMVVQEEMH
jgi:hypothetical protein